MTSSAEKPRATLGATRGAVLARNVAFNFLSQFWLVMLALVATPYIIKKLGVEQYGFFVLLTALTGYFAFLDFGLGTASVKYISEYRARGDHETVQAIVRTSFAAYLFIAAFGAALIVGSSSWLIGHVIRVGPRLESSAQTAFYVAAAGFALSMPAVAFGAIPAALQRFDVRAKRNIAFGTLSVVATVGAAYLGYAVLGVLIANVAVGTAATLSFFVIAHRLLPECRMIPGLDISILRRLTTFGTLKFIQQVSSRSSLHMDKFLIGAFVSLPAVGYYTIPLSLSQSVIQSVGNIAIAAFPAASGLYGSGEVRRFEELYVRSTKFVAVVAIGLTSLMFVYSDLILRYWINASFARESSTVLKFLAVAYLAYALTMVPGLAVDASGRPRVTAAFGLLNFIAGLSLALVLIPAFGIVGAAAAGAVNAGTQVIAFAAYAHRRVLHIPIRRVIRESLLRPFVAGVVASACMFAARPLVSGLGTLVVILGASFALYVIVVYAVGSFDKRDRDALKGVWARRRETIDGKRRRAARRYET